MIEFLTTDDIQFSLIMIQNVVITLMIAFPNKND